jgi:hypothetical protein
MPRIKGPVATQKLFGPNFVYTRTDDSEKCAIIDDDDENQFANGQRSRDLQGRPDANGELAQTKSGRAGDLKIMNLVILIDSAQMFFRNFGLRHVNAAFGDFAIELAGPKAGRMIIALFARPVKWLRSRLRPPGSRNVDRGAMSEAEGLRGGGQLSSNNRLLCGPPDIAARDRIRF